jgi:N-acetylmuramoyl-L-alanine amidase
MNIQRDLLTVNPFSRPGKNLADIKALVIHRVANAGSTARQNRNYFESLKDQSPGDPSARYASAHLIVGIEGEVIQCIPAEEMAYHVGAKKYTPEALGRLGHYPNNCTVGIELCHPEADGCFTFDTLSASMKMCALLCVQSNLDPCRDIWTHFAITGKVCPRWYVVYPSRFEDFKFGVAQEQTRLRRLNDGN